MSRLPGGSNLQFPDLAYLVTESSQVAEVRRLAVSRADRLGFDEPGRGRLALIVTEAATNLIKHARGGHLLVRALKREASNGIEVLALDRGPGMKDPERCLSDGYSTTGSAGTGLGAIRRLSDGFDLFTAPARGSVLAARLWTAAAPREDEGWKIGALCVPKSGETVCGDAWAVEPTSSGLAVLVADGLGHGPIAATASMEAVRVFRACAHLDPVSIVQQVHAALRSTRGAAVAVAAIDRPERRIRFVGVGNISATSVVAEETRSMISHNGTAGAEARKIQEFIYPLPARGLLVLHSDGIATHWKLSSFPGLIQRDPSLVAGVLYEHFQRGRDDATLVVLSEPPEGSP